MLVGPVVDMVDRTQVIIHFDTDGAVITDNQNFLDAMEYELEEVVGKKHAIFVDQAMVASPEYAEFWATLKLDGHVTSQFPRSRMGGTQIWTQATYSAVLFADGAVDRVVSAAADISQRRKCFEDISGGLEALNRGNLTHRLEMSGFPELGHIADGFNQASQQLNEAMGLLGSVSASVEETIQKVNPFSNELSQRTGRQAATLEETAASLELLMDGVRSSSQSARDAETMSQAAKTAATNSEKVVGKTIEAMSSIKESSKEISKIILVMDDIAFQTNLLALNAGVEAARAGDGGKGFEVVGSEVGLVARRSQEAAAKINTLISASSTQVSQGVEMVNGAGEELKKIIGNVSEIADRNSDFAEKTSA